jgi:hypothetical protein
MNKGNVTTRMVIDYQEAKVHIGHKIPSEDQTL